MTEAEERGWWKRFGLLFLELARAEVRRLLSAEAAQKIAVHGSDWLLDEVLRMDEQRQKVPPYIYKALSEFGWAERMGHGVETRWIFTLRGREALSERQWERQNPTQHRAPKRMILVGKVEIEAVANAMVRLDADWNF